MDFKQLESKLENLKRIESKVNNDKNILLIEIMKQNKLLSFFVENALHNQNMILSLKNKYQIKSPLISKSPILDKVKFLKKIANLIVKPKELWIYVTEEQKYSTDSYSRYEENILNNINKKNTDFIVIGERAKKFCSLNNLNIIHEIDKGNNINDLSWQLTQIIKILFIEEHYEAVHFVINSNKNVDGHFTILPISGFNINRLIENENKLKKFPIEKFKIYPNIEDFLNNQIEGFIGNSIQSLLVESSFYKSKVGLVSTNKIINELNEEIKKLNKKVIRIKRELEIEEIVLLTKNNEKFLKKKGHE